MPYHIGQRLSLKGQLCTIRYIGPVADKPGEWLGVEWDDSARGKHNGTHNNISYFTCTYSFPQINDTQTLILTPGRSTSPTPASFLRPNQPWDEPRSFLGALREKYASQDDPSDHEAIQISAHKQAEEIGFDKFARRQAELRGIRTVVLDRMCIQHCVGDPENAEIGTLCEGVADLDVSNNLFDRWSQVADLARRLPNLRSLTVDGNRLSSGLSIDEDSAYQKSEALPGVRWLSISNALRSVSGEAGQSHAVSLRRLSLRVPDLETLVACNNEWEEVAMQAIPMTMKTLDLSGNFFQKLTDIGCLAGSKVETLILKNCHINSVYTNVQTAQNVLSGILELDVRGNTIDSWSFINDLAATMPNLQHLRTANNPLYANLRSAEGKLLTPEDGYMLTLARLPTLQTLNYSKITDKERLNAETYYLNQIALELSLTTSPDERKGVKARHPRWQALCEEYGEPAFLSTTTSKPLTPNDDDISRPDPNTLAARMVTLHFRVGSITFSHTVPRSTTIYALSALAAKALRFRYLPPQCRLMLQTAEQVVRFPSELPKEVEGPGWWDSGSDSSDEDGEEEEMSGEKARARRVKEDLMGKEVELGPGVRGIGTFLEEGQREAEVVVKIMGRPREVKPSYEH
ncbi:hypothetical protein B0A50_05860 [Salinomyces thailandicus]|uniref:CAP-Gly domain-containing protein n=1 Tax=Salinomyces thailandicus TaxID=706561 RepID=A0A4U0TTY6_9PEZI|nr:hypothetical protein B0A50_05860 [Salinomyces thailandica]